MKTLSSLLASLLLPLLAIATERGPAVPDYPAERITDAVYVIHGSLNTPNPENQGFMNNPGIVLTSAGAVIIDPGSSVQSGEMVLRALAGLGKPPVVAVFNTHVHGDHWLGNQAIHAAYPDAPIYGHPNMIRLIDEGAGNYWIELMEQMTAGKTHGTEAVAPDHTVENGDVITLGDHHFHIHHYGPAHTTSDLMIEVAEEKTVFLGDNVLNGRIPPMSDGSITGDIASCRKILETDATHYVPGHGKSGDAQLVHAMLHYYDTVYRSVEELYPQGKSDYEMKDDIRKRLPEYADWVDFDVQLGKHISQSWLQVEADSF